MRFFTFLALASCSSAFAQIDDDISSSSDDGALIVVGKALDLLGTADTATRGSANREELSQRPTLRRGELLEVVPGVVVTQHSGGGKANQYFVRGYNLDHGTDFHVGVDGAPGNYRTHAHGQGYADLNFIVPEFVERLDYIKGPFFADYGDLSTAGGADYQLVPYLEHGIASVSYGAFDYARFLIGDSWELGKGILTLGGEYSHENGPWNVQNDYNRYNGFAKWYAGDEDNFLSVTGLFHAGDWNSTDQIPERALESGLVDKYGSLDDTTGGETSRNTITLNTKRTEDDWSLKIDAWLGTYSLDLFSNFTYFTDPVNGDQFEQSEDRIFSGLNVTFNKAHTLYGLDASTTVGFQTKHDWINDIGLYSTTNRVRTATTNLDDVYQGSYGLFIQNELFINDRARLITGLRGDLFYFDVESVDTPADTNSEWDGILSPKLSFAYDLGYNSELYASTGLGFHSNDARGVTASEDPVDALVRTQGAEIGLRTKAVENLSATIGLWWIQSDSEFVYVGDEGTTAPGPASTRYGIETAFYWRPNDHFTADFEYSWSFAQADVPSGEIDEIDNSVPHVISAGLTFGHDLGLYGSLRARYIASRPLVSDNNVTQSRDNLQVNARLGYKWDHFDVSLDVLNLLDRNDRDIEYFYESQLPVEASPVEDVHFHPSEPRQVRVNITYYW